jgi:hypothetical protein
MQGINQLDFSGQIAKAISLMKYTNSFCINASLCEYLNQDITLQDEESKKLYLGL